MEETITINGIEYVKRAPPVELSNVRIFRCTAAGVHAGVLVKRTKDGKTVVKNSRRLWEWWSRATLSELAMTGPIKPEKNRYGCVLPTIELNSADICEEIPCSEEAARLIYAVPVWVAADE
jgi:hypothetical protein